MAGVVVCPADPLALLAGEGTFRAGEGGGTGVRHVHVAVMQNIAAQVARRPLCSLICLCTCWFRLMMLTALCATSARFETYSTIHTSHVA